MTQITGKHSPTLQTRTNKSRVTAGFLAIFLGGIGVHKFYLGSVGWGVVYLIFSWTWIPAILGIIEGIIYFSMSDHSFKEKYA